MTDFAVSNSYFGSMPSETLKSSFQILILDCQLIIILQLSSWRNYRRLLVELATGSQSLRSFWPGHIRTVSLASLRSMPQKSRRNKHQNHGAPSVPKSCRGERGITARVSFFCTLIDFSNHWFHIMAGLECRCYLWLREDGRWNQDFTGAQCWCMAAHA